MRCRSGAGQRKPECRRQRIGNTGIRDVGVRMRHVQSHTGCHEVVHDAALCGCRGNAVHRPQKQRVMRDEQVVVVGAGRVTGSENDSRGAFCPQRSEQFVLPLRIFTVIPQKETVVRRLQNFLNAADRTCENGFSISGTTTPIIRVRRTRNSLATRFGVAKLVRCPEYPRAHILHCASVPARTRDLRLP